ncbi:mitogen-activated protein kinase kinase [Martiniozyma asiatica (nom. inval.)]|nr:mitogen-activated protein kinase kinase [Martiniozyma asiatica]
MNNSLFNSLQPPPALPSLSLQRRNKKQLTLSSPKPLDAISCDPEAKSTPDELIENIKNLELGVEYHIPLKPEDLVLLKKLGQGQSGTVSKVLHLPTQKTMARKVVHLETKEIIQSQILRELRIMHECSSPFITKFYGTFLNEGNVVICMEYVDCGSLDHIFQITGPFPEFILSHIAKSVLSGLIYLYDNHKIIHRDVKPSNVLMNSKGKIRLCDFGVSRELINSMADTFVGTSTYMSPERIQGGVYSIKGDIWSLGLMLYELASGKHAFTDDPMDALQLHDNANFDNNKQSNNINSNNNNNFQREIPKKTNHSILELLQRIVNESPPALSPKQGYSAELCDFIEKCLKKEKQRGSPWELMDHPFLKAPSDDSLIKKWAKNVRKVQKGKKEIE